MSTSSTASIPLIPMGESCQRAAIFNVEMKKGQRLSQVFTGSDIIAGLVFEQRIREPVVIEKLDMSTTLLVFPEDTDV